MTSGSTVCNKCTRKMNGITSSGKIISNDEGNNNGDLDDEYGNELDANDSFYQIAGKRAHGKTRLTVPENDLREYNYLQATTGTDTEDVVMIALALRKKNSNNNHLVLLIRYRRQLRHLILLNSTPSRKIHQYTHKKIFAISGATKDQNVVVKSLKILFSLSCLSIGSTEKY